MHPVVHFEMPYEDKSRMAEFYKQAFGWKAQMMGPEMGEYVVMQTSETDGKGMIKEPGRINGGFYKKTDDPSSAYPSFVIAVKDIQEAMQKVKDAGGTVVGGSPNKPGEPDMIPGVGLWCSCRDSEGNRISILQPDERM